ncbi:asparagine synthase-related protein [Roseibacterium sp. SDUM158016]|uniref:asparagine synthase-related protein n=1 Tax=Roseicyclus sediminis TaxID=2980997 RepID=UPI0021D2875B|nr:asparagine synthase-related protein [Roseibacterium sp. SDUM158016]MCU4653921.1 asparagine synthase-related protein [Roseibacterium sp. SDUM158016]
MGAIIGRIELDGRPIIEAHFRKAADIIRPYGQQHFSSVVEQNCAFAMCDQGVARGRPIAAEPLSQNGLTIVGDVILDDRAGLAASLGMDTREARDYSDIGLILAAWNRFGSACVDKLVGDFAFGVWEDEKRRCWLVRDHIGTRPLYWSRRKDTVIFATDIRAIVAFDEFNWGIDEHMVAHYLDDPYRPMPKTFFKDINSVHPGGITALDAVGVRTELWWQPKAVTAPGHRRPDEVVEVFRDLTETAVRCRIDTELPVGAHISGGIDSTIVTGLSAQALAAEGRALAGGYTWSPGVSGEFPDIGPDDERRILKDCSERYNFTLRYSDSQESETRLQTLFRPMAYEGTADLAEEIDVLSKAKADGVRVLLSGWGGDEAFSSHGFGYLAWMLRHQRFGDAARAINVRRKQLGLATTSGYVWRSGIIPMLPNILFRRVSPFYDLFPDQCFANQELMRNANESGVFQRKNLRIHSAPTILDQEMIARGHIATRMETWVSWGAKSNITYRYPLTDRRLLDFILSLAPNERYDHGYGRTLPVKAFRSMLPKKISKTDVVNERKRQVMRMRCLRQLVEHEDTIRRAELTPWLDQGKFREARVAAARMSPAQLRGERRLFANIFGATRVLYLTG